MIKIGLTGGIGSGKSTVAKMFEVLGVPVFRADDEARRLQDEDPLLKQAIIRDFGSELYASGRLDRAKLAAIVFNERVALARLSAIVHPAVREAFQAWCAKHASAPYVIMEAAILTESGGASAFDALVVVSAPEDVRMQRVMHRDGVDLEAVRARMKNQADEATRLANADHVITNDGNAMLIPQVLELHRRFSQA